MFEIFKCPHILYKVASDNMPILKAMLGVWGNWITIFVLLIILILAVIDKDEDNHIEVFFEGLIVCVFLWILGLPALGIIIEGLWHIRALILILIPIILIPVVIRLISRIKRKKERKNKDLPKKEVDSEIESYKNNLRNI